MAYTDDAVKAKLSSLQESQESIVTVAQWIMFHRRYADRTAQLWVDKLKESSSSKRLNLVYLVNEVVQQSKARKKDDFVRAFGPIMADAAVTAYKGASMDVQQKLNRVIAVWRDRAVFEIPVQDNIESSAHQFDRARQPERKARLGGSLTSNDSSSIPPDVQPLMAAYSAITKLESPSTTAATTAFSDFDQLTKPGSPELAPPVLAGRLSTLLKSLASAESSVGEAVKARKHLIAEVEKLLESQKVKLAVDEEKHQQLSTRKTDIEGKKRTVEAEIMRSLESEGDIVRPDMEPLTPPPIESLTPVGSPTIGFGLDGASEPTAGQAEPEHQLSAPEPVATAIPTDVEIPALVAALQDSRRSVSASEDPRLAKRPRLGGGQQDDELAAFADGGMNDVDEDITAMLNPT